MYNYYVSVDIGHILNEWPFEPGQVSARRIRGADGRDKIQLRLDLGLLQMEVTGRPDGARPHGFESLLSYYEHQLEAHRQQSGSDSGFQVDEEGCELLRSESLMFYHRYLAEFVLEDYEAVERDTLRNLRLMDFLNQHAEEESDRYALDQYRPYVLMMYTRSRARTALGSNRAKAAVSILRSGIEQITQFYRKWGQEELIAESGELAVLRAMLSELESRVPVDPVQRLRRELAKAVREERYEDAANLRDQLNAATGKGKDAENSEL